MDSFLSANQPVKHVDRKELYTCLEARVSYLHSFLDFNSSMSECIAAYAVTDGDISRQVMSRPSLQARSISKP